jgi:HEAT repeat protein
VLADADPSVRHAARIALAGIAGADAVRAVADRLSATQRHREARQLAMALAAMGTLGEAALIRKIDSGSEDIKGLAAEALGISGSTKAVPALIGLLDGASGGPVRRSAVLALSLIGAPAAGALVEGLAHDREPVARGAREALLGMRRARLAESLREALSHEKPAVRGAAAEILAAQGDASVVPDLIWTLDHDRDTKVRGQVAAALGSLGNRLATRPLVRAARHEDPEVRFQVAVALGRLGDRAAVIALKRLAEDADGTVAMAAVEALQTLNSGK